MPRLKPPPSVEAELPDQKRPLKIDPIKVTNASGFPGADRIDVHYEDRVERYIEVKNAPKKRGPKSKLAAFLAQYPDRKTPDDKSYSQVAGELGISVTTLLRFLSKKK